MNGRALWRIGWRYLSRHPRQTFLMVLGIALGVAVVIAVDLANASASRAFDLSTEAIAGRATHQVVGSTAGLDEGLYTAMRRQGIAAAAAPAISEYITSPSLGNVPMQLLGLDPFAEAPFRDYLGGRAASPAAFPQAPGATNLAALLTQPGAILISLSLAEQYGLRPCASPTTDFSPTCRIQLEIAGQTKAAWIAGLLTPSDDLARRALDGLVIADIATAQELTGRLGRLDRIDLILPAGNQAQPDQIQAWLPAGARLMTVQARSGAVAQMTDAFRVNLTALSLLALLVGMFLIYNTMTFSVVQRRPLFGTLRCLGVTRQEIFALVIGEALLVGTAGAALGTALGVLLGQGAVRLVTQTINDLFFVVTVRGVQIPPISLTKGILLGVTATLLTAAPPAWEAASVSPRAALSRSGLESKARQAVLLAAGGGVVLLVAGAAILAWPTLSLVVSFAGTFAVTVGLAMLTPLATNLLMRGAMPVLGSAWGTLGRMAPRNVANSLSRTSIAIAALMVAVSVTIGVSLMVGSFRRTVITWLEQMLQGDIYISLPGPAVADSSGSILPQAQHEAAVFPGVARADLLRSVTVASPQGPVHMAATNNYSLGNERTYVSIDVPPGEVYTLMRHNSAVLVSEPLANRLGLPAHGGQLTLETAQGPRQFPVLGIFYDYASTEGMALMALDTYRLYWQDESVTAIGLRLGAGAASPDEMVSYLRPKLGSLQHLEIRANKALRGEALAIFDRTFAITGALQLLATVVAFIGILSALLSLELERQHELGILRAIGLTAQQLWALILAETGLMGVVAGLLAMPTGYMLALILVYIINRRSFGWTLQMQVAAGPFLQALAVAVAAALLAGFYPALRMSKMLASEALRSEEE